MEEEKTREAEKTREKKLALIDEVLSRGVDNFIDPDGSFKQKLTDKANGTYNGDIVIKLGVDPTRPDIHIGHAVLIRKLRHFQDLGCKVIFLVGDFTARIGDPTGKSKVRPEIAQKEVERNMETYLEQIGKILIVDDPSRFSWIRNSEWYLAPEDISVAKGAKPSISVKTESGTAKAAIEPNSFVGKAIVYEGTRMQKTHLKRSEIYNITLRGLLWTLKHVTHSQLIARDMFQKRMESGEELYMHEMMYPVLQGIDSYLLAQIYGSCDLEIGGTDQHFNMLMGRDVMKANSKEPQAVISYRLLEGTDGDAKMSKSQDNYISIIDAPEDMYGKVMSIKDRSILNYFELAALTSLDEVENIRKEIESDALNPRDAKMRLAREIVSMYHGEEAAEKAEAHFRAAFQKHETPDDIPVIEAVKDKALVDLLIENNFVESKSAFRRLVEGGGVKTLPEEEKITDPQTKVAETTTLKIGKKKFARIVVS